MTCTEILVGVVQVYYGTGWCGGLVVQWYWLVWFRCIKVLVGVVVQVYRGGSGVQRYWLVWFRCIMVLVGVVVQVYREWYWLVWFRCTMVLVCVVQVYKGTGWCGGSGV
ncbi:uncharacterized protein [Haliotis asinina]|uniref:uncharacterized protein n=1 Tax=Haliotis asinina TaxID=109174 RepID=UPI0035322B58